MDEIKNSTELSKSELETFYYQEYCRKVLDSVDVYSITDKLYHILKGKILEEQILEVKQIKFIETGLKKLLCKGIFMSLKDGFIRNVMNVESGTMTTFEGDSAQLIFVGRAILAGLKCSNIDVRSIRYDAVIDFEGGCCGYRSKVFQGGLFLLKTELVKDRE